MTGFWAATAAGAVCGILSGMGVGGGSVLLIWLTTFGGLDQQTAQGVNLLYFLPAAAAALPAHFKRGDVEKSAALPALLVGLAGAGLGAWAATAVEVAVLRRLFGAFLILTGISSLFPRSEGAPEDECG